MRDVAFGETVEESNGIDVLVDNVSCDHGGHGAESEELVLDQVARVRAQVVHFEVDPTAFHEAFALSHALGFALHDYLPEVVREDVDSVEELFSS